MGKEDRVYRLAFRARRPAGLRGKLKAPRMELVYFDRTGSYEADSGTKDGREED